MSTEQEVRFEGNHVMTANKSVAVGDVVCYYESMPTTICDCKVLELWHNEKEYGFKLEIVRPITEDGVIGETFTCSAVYGNHDYRGMWRLYNKGQYR